MKKILAVLLAAMLVMSMSIMAFAAEKATIVKNPTKTEYKADEDINLAGLVIKCGEKEVTFNDTTKADFNFTPAKMTKDTTKVAVTYTLKEEGKADVEYTVDVAVTLKKEEDKSALKIVAPLNASYDVEDAKAKDDFLSKLEVLYTDKEGKSTTVKYSDAKEKFTVAGFDVSKAGEVTVTITYEGKSADVKVTVKEKASAKIVVKNAKGVYKVDEAFDTGLTISYIPEGGKAEDAVTVKYTDGEIGVKGFNTSKVAEKVTVTVSYKGLEASYDIAVVEKDRLDKETIVGDLWGAKAALDKNPNATIEDYVKAYTTIISQYMAADDLDDIVKYVKAQDEVQELVQDSSLYPDNWSEFVKIYTDYVPTGVNQALDIAARLGWDASDQDFVQDIIDLVKGAAESDKAAEATTATNNGGSTGSTTDANPKTGSASAIAVFAVLSVAAAAAVVCTKKKED